MLTAEKRKNERLTGLLRTVWDVVGKGFPGSGEYVLVNRDQTLKFLIVDKSVSICDLILSTDTGFSTSFPFRSFRLLHRRTRQRWLNKHHEFGR